MNGPLKGVTRNSLPPLIWRTEIVTCYKFEEKYVDNNQIVHTVTLKGSLAEYRGVTLSSFGLILWSDSIDHVAWYLRWRILQDFPGSM